MQDQALLDLVKSGVRILNGRCEFLLCNETPSNWGVTILEAGVKFFYRDDSDDTDGPRRVNLQSSQCHSFYSRESTKCVWQVYCVLKVHAVGEPNDATYDYRETAKDGECFLKVPVRLGPKSSVSETELSSGNWSVVLEVKHV